MTYIDKYGPKWQTDWSGRKGPHPITPEELEAGKAFFPETLLPILQHPLFAALGDEAKMVMQVQAAHNYLFFTEILETEAVNPATLRIANGTLDFGMPRHMVRLAKKIYRDEAHHAEFSDELSYEIEMASGIPRFAVGRPRFMRMLEKRLASLPAGLRPVAELLFVVVSETLISGILAKIPDDPTVISALCLTVKDHAADEGRHHSYFSGVLEQVWPRLTPEQKAIIGPMLADFIEWFLAPDFDVLRAELEYFPLTHRQVEAIIEETYPQEIVTANILSASKKTLSHFRNNGLFADSRIADAFCERGFPVTATGE